MDPVDAMLGTTEATHKANSIPYLFLKTYSLIAGRHGTVYEGCFFSISTGSK